MSSAIQCLPRRRAGRAARAFTFVEVMLAGMVLALGIAGSIVVLLRGFQSLDTARHLTSATQVMQNEMEQLRLKSWDEIQQLQDRRDTAVAVARELAAGRIACTRDIRDIRAGMKEIVLTATWQGLDGRDHSARLITRYGRNGLNDYYYTIH